ncbi:MAG: GTP cyclohydrolase I FolE [candidate division Zixibacteria bacterium]|nr:GTP cyclohydrolase I FolE [candidate division Zixibacteria bacterium]
MKRSPKKKIDKDTIQRGFRLVLKGLGIDSKSEGLKDTPRRMAEFYEQFFSGLQRNPREKLKLYRAENRDEMIIAKDIHFFSMCEHHFLPFFGYVHIAYIPENNTITGFSRLVEVVEAIAKRPQIQERMTTEIAEVLMDVLHPKGVLVIVEAEQLCLTMRGFGQPGVKTVSSAVRGALRKNATREEALLLIKSP